MRLPKPTLTYPQGGELFDQTGVRVEWNVPPLSDSDIATSIYEVLVSDNVDINSPMQARWVVVGSVPASHNSFTWLAPKNVNSNRLYMGVRLVNSNGVSSDMSFCSKPFSRYGFRMDAVEIVSPLGSTEISGNLELRLNVSKVRESLVHLRLFALLSSQSLGITKYPLIDGERIASSYKVDISRIGNCDDAKIVIYTRDTAGRSSVPVTVSNLMIRNTGTFLLDTVGPDISLDVAGGQLYVNSTDVDTKLYAYDDTTAISACRFDIYDVSENNLNLVRRGEPRRPQFDMIVNLAGGDGRKSVQVDALDVGCNPPREINSTIKSVVKVEGKSIFSTGRSILYANPVSAESFVVYRASDDVRMIATLPSLPIAATEFQGVYYFSLENVTNAMHVVSTSAGSIDSVYLSDTPSSAAVYLLGHRNGVVAFDSSGIAYRLSSGLIDIIDDLGGPVSSARLMSDGTIFVSLSQEKTIVIMTPQGVVDRIAI